MRDLFWGERWVKGKFDEYEGDVDGLESWLHKTLKEYQRGVKDHKLDKRDVKEVMDLIRGSNAGRVLRYWEVSAMGVEVSAIEAFWMNGKVKARAGRIMPRWSSGKTRRRTKETRDRQLDDEDIRRIMWMVDRDKYWAQVLERYEWLKGYDVEYDDYVADVHEGWKIVQVINGEDGYLVTRNFGRIKCRRLLSVIANVGFLSRISYEEAEKLRGDEVEDMLLKGIWG